MTDIQAINAVNQQTYDQLANEYEQRAERRSSGNLDRVTYFSHFITSGHRVLDIGCAVGIDIEHFYALGFEVEGIDISPRMASFASKRNPNSHIIVGDFIDTHFNIKYDAVFARAFIHLFPKNIAIEIMRKIYNLLVDNGVAFFGVSADAAVSEGWQDKQDYPNGYKRYKKVWSEDELKAALRETGFEILDVINPIDSEGKQRLAISVRKA